MENWIKEYQQICVITKKDGSVIQTTASLEVLEKMINDGPQMLRFWDELVNRYEIIWVKKQQINWLDAYIANITDTTVKQRMRDIIKERESKNLKTNGVNHLIQIYTDRFWEISNEESQEW